MGRVFHIGGDLWAQFLKGASLIHRRPFCSNKYINCSRNNYSKNNDKAVAVRNDDVYRQLDKLDFMTAAKILFTTPPKKKKFGIDFHLVQLFFACMPSLAVFLVAQYARYEIRRMEAEVEPKKKKEEEEKAKEMESNTTDEGEVGSDPELLKVKVRLNALEEAVKEIVVESKKLSGGKLAEDDPKGSMRKQVASVGSDPQSKSEGSTAAVNDYGKRSKSGESMSALGQDKLNVSAPAIDALQQGQKKGSGKAENGGGSQEVKK